MSTLDRSPMTFDQMAALYGLLSRRTQEAPAGSRSEAIWMGRRDRFAAAIAEWGLAVRRSPITDGYMVGYPQDFIPVEDYATRARVAADTLARRAASGDFD